MSHFNWYEAGQHKDAAREAKRCDRAMRLGGCAKNIANRTTIRLANISVSVPWIINCYTLMYNPVHTHTHTIFSLIINALHIKHIIKGKWGQILLKFSRGEMWGTRFNQHTHTQEFFPFIKKVLQSCGAIISLIQASKMWKAVSASMHTITPQHMLGLVNMVMW